MENCSGDHICFICRRPTPENSSTNSEKLISNATLLQDFLNCFHINGFESVVNDLSTSCQFCPTCEQFIAEWSSIQTQMTQLIRRAAQLKATLSTLLLSAPQIQEQIQNKDVPKIKNSQEIKLALLLQEIVDDIRNELRKKYLVNVMVDKIQLPCQRSIVNQEEVSPLLVYSDNDDDPMDDESHEVYLPNEDQLSDLETSEQKKDSAHVTSDKIPLPPVLKLDPLLVDYDNVDGTWNHWECGKNIPIPVVPKIDPLAFGDSTDGEPSELGADESDQEYWPRDDELNDDEPPEQILGLSMETDEQAYCDDSNFQDSEDSKRAKDKAGSSNKTEESSKKYERRGLLIRDGPNKFKYNGFDVILNDEDERYYCGICNYRGQTTVFSTFVHIRKHHYTAEDKIKFTAIKTSDTEWIYGGKYKIIKLDEKKYKCVSCGCEMASLYTLVTHIRSEHVGTFQLECPETRRRDCLSCKKRFYCEVSFQRHMKFHELGEEAKEHKCEICGKGFFTLQHCKDHQRLHTGEKPYICQICGEKFPGSSYLTRHRKWVHGIQPEGRRAVKVRK